MTTSWTRRGSGDTCHDHQVREGRFLDVLPSEFRKREKGVNKPNQDERRRLCTLPLPLSLSLLLCMLLCLKVRLPVPHSNTTTHTGTGHDHQVREGSLGCSAVWIQKKRKE
jgi:hypothetical protein